MVFDPSNNSVISDFPNNSINFMEQALLNKEFRFILNKNFNLNYTWDKKILWFEILQSDEPKIHVEKEAWKTLRSLVIESILKREILKDFKDATKLLEWAKIKGDDELIAILSLITGDLKGTEEEKTLFEWMCSKIEDRRWADSENLFVELLARNKVLPFKPLLSRNLMLVVALQKGNVSLVQTLKKIYGISREMEYPLECLNNLSHDLSTAKELSALLMIFDQMEIISLKLKVYLPGIEQYVDSFQEEFNQARDRYSKANKWLKENKDDWSGLSFNNKITSYDNCIDILSLIMLQKAYHKITPDLLLGNLSRCFDLINAPKVNFLLDKVIYDKKFKFEGGTPFVDSFMLGAALKTISFSESKKSAVQSFCRKLSLSLMLCAKWESDGFRHKNFDMISKEIVDVLKDPKVDFPILIPVGSYNHICCLSITKVSDTLVDIGLDNTIKDLPKDHPRIINPQRFQTHLVMKGVPIQYLLDLELLVKFLNTNESSDTQALYRLFNSLGKVESPSMNEFDYQPTQNRDTCPAESKMSFLRYAFLNFWEQSPNKEILNDFELLKKDILFFIGIYQLEKVDTRIQRFVIDELKRINQQ